MAKKKNSYTDDKIDPKIKNLSCVNIVFLIKVKYVWIGLIFCLVNKTVRLSTPTSAAIARIEIPFLRLYAIVCFLISVKPIIPH
jgi:hypothetical protein